MNEKQKTYNLFSIQKDFENNSIKPIYLFYGEDNFLHSFMLEKIKEHLTRHKQQVNYQIFYGEGLDFEKLSNSLYSLLLGFSSEDLNCIVIRQLERVKGDPLQKINTIINNLSFEQNDRLILLFTNSKQIPKQMNLEKIKKYGAIINLNRLNKVQVRELVRMRCKDEHTVITDEALYYLQSVTGNDVSLIINELDKLFCFLGASVAKITKNDILNSVYGLKSGNIFDFIEAFSERDAVKAIDYLRKIMNNDESHPLQILAMINRQIGLLHRAKLFPKDIKIIKGDENLPYFVIQRIIAQSQKFKIGELKKAYESMLKAEISLKTGSLLPNLILEHLVMEITKNANFSYAFHPEQPVL